MPEATFMGVPRSKILWYPRINYEKCNLCEGYSTPKCIEFCAHFVFDIVEENGKKKLIVKNPEACPVFCVGCQQACPIPGAITFPDKEEINRLIQKLRQEQQQK